MEWNKETTKRYYDKKRTKAARLEKGQRVYLRRRTVGKKEFNIKTDRRLSKFDCLRIGPFEVEEVLSHDNYKLKLPERMRIHPIFHISLLDRTPNPATEEDISAYEEEYQVEKIINQRTRKGLTEYRVRWTNYDEADDTWEPVTNLHCPKRIKEFEEQKKKQAGRYDE
jgi:hypothetical protein